MSEPAEPFKIYDPERFYHGTKADLKPGEHDRARIFLQLHGAEIAMDLFQ